MKRERKKVTNGAEITADIIMEIGEIVVNTLPIIAKSISAFSSISRKRRY